MTSENKKKIIKKKPSPSINETTVAKKQNKSSKQKLGQFYTTNFEYILSGMNIPDDINHIIEPFAGNGDLLGFIKDKSKYKIDCYDIDPKQDYIIKRDTLNNPPSYTNAFTISNPPYLARNKSKDKAIFNKYDVNDLYKCDIKELITNKCLGGIRIIPLNFWSSIRKADIELRKAFLGVYDITRLNIFEEQVFDDTTYTTCAFQFTLKKEQTNNSLINSLLSNIWIYPSKTQINAILSDNNDWLVGGDIYKLKTQGKYTIARATSSNKDKLNTNILVKCIDDNAKNQLGLSIVSSDDLYIDETPNLSSRTYASLIITPSINDAKQKKLVEKFNSFLADNRKRYHSLFLTNYRESKDIARKRISFDLVYQIVEHILDSLDT